MVSSDSFTLVEPGPRVLKDVRSGTPSWQNTGVDYRVLLTHTLLQDRCKSVCLSRLPQHQHAVKVWYQNLSTTGCRCQRFVVNSCPIQTRCRTDSYAERSRWRR